MKRIALVFAFLALSTAAEAKLVRLRVERRELILAGKPFGLAGPYEKLVGRADFAVDPRLPQNQLVIDLSLAPTNPRGEVEFSAGRERSPHLRGLHALPVRFAAAG